MIDEEENERLGTATYSPEDNKLRFYPFARLDKALYDRVKAAGFSWAPKQELFVAPMWTPPREDLLIELCGEVGDEDKSLVDRAEERAERFEDYGENRTEEALRAKANVSAIADNIPFGQPILVGHHSERRARKDAEKIENGMRKAVKLWDQARYWQDRATSALRHAKYKELPGVRARRIKGIEADKRKIERTKAGHESGLRFWSGQFQLVSKDGSRRPLEITEENRALVARVLGNTYGFSAPVAPNDDGSQWTAWDVLRPDDERYEKCPSMTVAELQAKALAFYPVMIARCDRWLAHYENRLAYERAMLDEQGGTAADQVKPEKGGACKCWASPRGGWSIIQKVNKVSVTVLDNWGSGGKDFTRTIPFDKLSSLWSKAQVDQARAEGRLISETAQGFYAERSAPKLGTMSEPKGKTQEEKEFEALRDAIKAGVQVVSAPQLFPTPPGLAERVVELAEIGSTHSVLEPSAGTGVLTHAVFNHSQAGRIVAVEINGKLVEHLRAAQAFLPERESNAVVHADFLSCNGNLGTFDRIIMNPPFGGGADIRHIEHALAFLNPGGRLVAICANGPRQQEKLMPLADQWIEMEEAFVEAGTNVRTAICVIQK